MSPTILRSVTSVLRGRKGCPRGKNQWGDHRQTDHRQHRKGFAGFRWNDTKFIVQELEVRGLVDEEWAKKELNKSPEESSGGGDDDFDF